MFVIKTGAVRPETARPGVTYPFDKLPVDGYFVVPKSEKREEDTDSKFRNRVLQAANSYSKAQNAKAHLTPGYDEATWVPLKFTTITLGKADPEKGQEWEEGDVGVWRDS